MENKERKRLSANMWFDFTGMSPKQKVLLVLQLALVIVFIVLQVIQLITSGVTLTSAGLLAVWLYCCYLIIRNARRAIAAKEKAGAAGEAEAVSPGTDDRGQG